MTQPQIQERNVGVRTGKSRIKARRIARVFWKERYLWLLVIPGILYFGIFLYALLAGPWVGFKWFGQFFESPYFLRLLRNTVLLNIYGLFWGFPAPIIFALMLNEVQGKAFKKLAQTLSYLPHFVSTVVIVGIISSLLGPESGLINLAIKAMGGTPINFMGSPQWFRTIYIGSGIWQDLGWSCIIYLAALAGVDPQLYEAAMIDGAGKFKRIWHVTLPGILPTVVIMLIMALGGMFSVGYEKIILMYNTSTYETADVINTYVFRRGIVGGEYSFGTAVGLFQSVINFALVFIVNKVSKKLSEISLW